MGRRNDHTHTELYFLILDTAKSIIINEGYSTLTARKVAVKMGYSVGTLYNVFENLNEIILRINLNTLKMLHESLKVIVDIRNLSFFYIGFCEEYPELTDMLFHYRVPNNEDTPIWIKNEIDDIFEYLTVRLSPLLRYDLILAKTAATVLWGGLHGLCILYLNGNISLVSLDSVYDLADSFVSNYLKGLLAV